jgi:hypothetical protein
MWPQRTSVSRWTDFRRNTADVHLTCEGIEQQGRANRHWSWCPPREGHRPDREKPLGEFWRKTRLQGRRFPKAVSLLSVSTCAILKQGRQAHLLRNLRAHPDGPSRGERTAHPIIVRNSTPIMQYGQRMIKGCIGQNRHWVSFIPPRTVARGIPPPHAPVYFGKTRFVNRAYDIGTSRADTSAGVPTDRRIGSTLHRRSDFLQNSVGHNGIREKHFAF